MPNLGIHTAKVSHVLEKPLKTRKTMYDAIVKDCETLNLNACQIFVQGPRNSKMANIDYVKVKQYCDEKKINLYVHSSYITVGVFSITADNMDTKPSQNAIKSITEQLKACDKLGSLGLVIHISKRTPEQIIESFKVMMPTIKKFKTPVLLEMPAKKPDKNLTYETPEKINKLTDLMLKEFPKYKWGWCIDTAHLFSAGIELDIPKVMKNWISDLKYPETISLLHLNGLSIKHFNTGKDSHQVIFGCEDDIWGDDIEDDNGNQVFDPKQIKKSSIYTLAKFAHNNGIDSILEINRGDYAEMMFSISTLKMLFT